MNRPMTSTELFERVNSILKEKGLLPDILDYGASSHSANLDDFTWEGTDVHAIDCFGQQLNWGYSCGAMTAALKRKDDLLREYEKVVVCDNAT